MSLQIWATGDHFAFYKYLRPLSVVALVIVFHHQCTTNAMLHVWPLLGVIFSDVFSFRAPVSASWIHDQNPKNWLMNMAMLCHLITYISSKVLGSASDSLLVKKNSHRKFYFFCSSKRVSIQLLSYICFSEVNKRRWNIIKIA